MDSIELIDADPATLAAIRAALGTPDAARTLRFPASEGSPPSPVLPSVGDRQGKLLGFSSGGAPEAVEGDGIGGGGDWQTPPLVADFTAGWVNQGTRAATDVAGSVPGLQLSGPNLAGTDNLGGLFKAIPTSGAWMRRMRATIIIGKGNYSHAGLALRNSTTGALVLFAWRKGASTSGYAHNRLHYTSPTTHSADSAERDCVTPAPKADWDMRLVCDGTNIAFEISPNGGLWYQVSSVSKTTFTTPDQVGVYINNYNAACAMFITHWEES